MSPTGSTPLPSKAPRLKLARPIVAPQPGAHDRRIHPRFTPLELKNRFAARHKYGEEVTLLDVSVGGMQLETPRFVRPDGDLVIEIIDARTRDVSQMVSRVLRAQVASLGDGIRYRAACAFKRPLAHPMLLVQAPPQPVPAPASPSVQDFLKLELALKTIVEGFFKRPHGAGSAGRWREPSSLLDALSRLRTAAERRRDPIDRQLGELLATLIPALQQKEETDAVLRRLHDQLGEQLPLLAIRTTAVDETLASDRERITLNMCVDTDRAPVAVTAEFPPGFGLDASQFRLLKLSAYLVGLVDNWNACAAAPADEAEPPVAEAVAAPAPESPTPEPVEVLPFGWHRVVLRYMDGQILRGYANDFHPDRPYLHLCPKVGCATNERMLVPIDRLKAVFFVKDFQGNRHRVDSQGFDHAPRGRRVEVTFRDGEVMLGSTLNYKPAERGFFLLPANSRSNNIRAFVVNAAIRHTRMA